MRLALGMLLLAVALLCLANYRASRSYFKVVDAVIDTFAVRQEMKRIAEVVYQDYISDLQYPGGNFSDYLRLNMKRSGTTKRDLANDWWGTPYQLRIAADRQSFSIYSAGADQRFATADDVAVTRQVVQPPPAASSSTTTASLPPASNPWLRPAPDTQPMKPAKVRRSVSFFGLTISW